MNQDIFEFLDTLSESTIALAIFLVALLTIPIWIIPFLIYKYFN